MTALLVYYFIFVTMAIVFTLILFKFLNIFMQWIAKLISKIR